MTPAEILSLAALAMFVAAGCRSPSSPEAQGDLDDLRTWAAAGHELADAASALCPAAPKPALCVAALADVGATLADADAVLAAVDACRADDSRCQEEAQVTAIRVGPRLAARLARLVLLTQGASGAR